ncbi:MAG: hypothetical protein WC256_05975 [Desulfurivibrionaceae bacterium]|jgi:hypothetical protein
MPSPKSKYKSPWKRFALNVSMVILLFISALFTGIYLNNQKTIEQGLKGRSQTLFSSLELSRKN